MICAGTDANAAIVRAGLVWPTRRRVLARLADAARWMRSGKFVKQEAAELWALAGFDSRATSPSNVTNERDIDAAQHLRLSTESAPNRACTLNPGGRERGLVLLNRARQHTAQRTFLKN